MVTVAPLTFYESKATTPPVVAWECAFAFDTHEYKLTRGCTCGNTLVVHFGFKGDHTKRVAGYMVCPDCQTNWYYEIPLTFVFKNIPP